MAKPSKPAGSPVIFRPSPDLERLVGELAATHRVRVNEMFKGLAALAAAGMDWRYYDLVAHLAAGMGGVNAYVRAVLHLHTVMQGVVRAAPRLLAEPRRSQVIVQVTTDAIRATGGTLPPEVVTTLYERLGLEASSAGDDQPRGKRNRPNTRNGT